MTIPHDSSEGAAAAEAPERSPLEMKRQEERRRRRRILGEAASGSPPRFRAELEAELGTYANKYRPRDPIEERYVEIAALSGLHWMRLVQAREAREEARVRAACTRFDAHREATAREAATALPVAPLDALARLIRTAAGCELLADGWAGLAERLEAAARPDPADCRQVLELLGFGEGEGSTDVGSADPRAVGPLAVPAATAARAVLAAGPDAAETAELRAVRNLLRRVAAERRDALDQLSDELWAEHDGPSRAEAAATAAFDPSADARLLERWIAEADRARRRALSDLERLRRGAADPHPPRRLRPASPPKEMIGSESPESPEGAAAPASGALPAEPKPEIAAPAPTEAGEPAADADAAEVVADVPAEPEPAAEVVPNAPEPAAGASPPPASRPSRPAPPAEPTLNRRQRRALKKKRRPH